MVSLRGECPVGLGIQPCCKLARKMSLCQALDTAGRVWYHQSMKVPIGLGLGLMLQKVASLQDVMGAIPPELWVLCGVVVLFWMSWMMVAAPRRAGRDCVHREVSVQPARTRCLECGSELEWSGRQHKWICK